MRNAQADAIRQQRTIAILRWSLEQQLTAISMGDPDACMDSLFFSRIDGVHWHHGNGHSELQPIPDISDDDPRFSRDTERFLNYVNSVEQAPCNIRMTVRLMPAGNTTAVGALLFNRQQGCWLSEPPLGDSDSWVSGQTLLDMLGTLLDGFSSGTVDWLKLT